MKEKNFLIFCLKMGEKISKFIDHNVQEEFLDEKNRLTVSVCITTVLFSHYLSELEDEEISNSLNELILLMNDQRRMQGKDRFTVDEIFGKG